ncbi:ComE operon protein 2 [Philodulcilactobacillus myokoensis]|uniref:ComE operon protein 2 n=1 Tax=Philodulcilactobacillus myokoensis TaxID=2929573 RepID=A0A9W6B161_9LACO|nr:ComE operon protein 2 [Philodulcilactobacillus myokoensis]GLB46990.1 ComE operon protein 2 [Philodulcilactobacillus myokoensis]
MDQRIPWDQYFMLQAVLISSRSTCNRLSVGATIVRDRRIIASGYNGSVSGDVHCTDKGCYMVDGHCLRTIHAEMNAIAQCAKFGEATYNSELYVTDFPCLQCTKVLLQSGIKQINYLRDYHDSAYAKSLIKLKHVTLKKIKLNPKIMKQLPFSSYLSN